MQKTILLFLCLFSIVRGYGQIGDVWDCTFEHPHDTIRGHLFIDTINYKHNIWQIGRPQKAVFDSARTYPNALVIDTVNTYPVNDTSVFILKQEWPLALWAYGSVPLITFSFQLQKDSGDKAIIEYSADTGKTWTDLIKSGDYVFDLNDTPSIDTSTNGWRSVWCYWAPRHHHPDSVFYRFTFISDSIDSHQDGWMIDNIVLDYYSEGYVQPLKDDNFISIYPNPCTDYLYIKSKKIATHIPQVSIYDALGRQLYDAPLTTDHIPINLPDGTYILRYKTDDAVAQKRFVVKR
ncbi:MAG: T9SS type A sorting domain-containing protein [Bacteroidetes bacterium]|nr:T9SS type A sorting domain-containing protein [Bacteroidota bacterium]